MTDNENDKSIMSAEEKFWVKTIREAGFSAALKSAAREKLHSFKWRVRGPADDLGRRWRSWWSHHSPLSRDDYGAWLDVDADHVHKLTCIGFKPFNKLRRHFLNGADERERNCSVQK